MAAVFAGVMALAPLDSPAYAQDATWLTNPNSADFNTGTNWSPTSVPTGIATFGASSRTSLTFSAGTTTVNSLLFNNSASAYTFGIGNQALTLSNGITNNSSRVQGFTVGSSGTLTIDGGSMGNSSITTSNDVTFQGTSSAGTSTINVSGSGASLNIFANSTAGSATVTASGGAAVNVDDSGSAGSATFTLSGTGTTMCFCNDADPSSATITVNTGAELQFLGNNASNTMRYIGGGGTFDLSSMGVSGVTIGSIEGSGSITLGSNNLTVGANNLSTTFSGAISGTGGSFTKTGSGTLTLSGTNTFTGLTTVSGGTLVLTGSLAGAATVSSGGTFKGGGTVGGNFTNNGIVAPGTSIGTLTVGGNFTQNSGGTYQVELNGSQSDRLNVTGTATLAGSVSVSGSYLLNTRYTILNTTGGRTGTFSSATGSLGLATPSLSYDANNVFLNLVLASNAFQSAAQTPNQAAVGRVLDQSAPTATGDFNAAISAIAGLAPGQVPAALDAIAGQNYSGFSTVAVQSAQAFMASFSQQAGTGSGTVSGGSGRLAVAQGSDAVCGVDACDAAATRWGAWGGGIGGAGTVAGNPNSHGIDYSLGGFATGLDYRFDPRLLAGVTAGFTSSTLYTQAMSGRGTSDTLQFGLYGSFTPGTFYVDALAGYARSQNRQQRPIIISGLSTRTAQGSTHADQFFGQLEGGYPVALGGGEANAGETNATLTPFARLQGSTSTQAAFSEWGADSLDLSIARQTTNSLRTVLGAQLSGNIARVAARFRLGWSHEYADTSRPVTASFAGAPQLGFTTQGADAPRDGALVGLGFDATVADATSLYARYDGEIQGGNTSHIFSAGLRMVW